MISIPHSRSIHRVPHSNKIAFGDTVMAVTGTRVDSSWCRIRDMDEHSDTRALTCGDIVFINELGDVRGVPWIVHRDLEGTLRICPIYEWNKISPVILEVVMEDVTNKLMEMNMVHDLIKRWVML